MRIALYQPEIAGNVGAVMRVCACWNLPLELIGPLGFAAGDKQLKRAAMDYGVMTEVTRHADWDAFLAAHGHRRLVLATKFAPRLLHDVVFDSDDVLLFGRESAGVPDSVVNRADLALRIPMREGPRSLNLAVSVAVTVGEALRQTGAFAEMS